MTSLSILRLIPSPPGKIIDGEIIYHGQDLVKKSEREMRSIRGNDISMIFQEPMTSLNPVFTVGQQIGESFRFHQQMGKAEMLKKSIEMLRLVGIPEPEHVINDYPNQLSGGMRQRVMIAMALACNPKILIADEPTTALDVTIQAQIMRLLKQLQEKMGTSIILITHDLGIVAQIAKHVMVMYCGQAVEYSDVRSIYKNPLHPYTAGLLRSIPKLTDDDMEELPSIPGMVPSPSEKLQGFWGYVLASLTNMGGILVWLILQYGMLFSKGVAFYPNEALSGIILIALVPTLAMASCFSKYLYKKTGNIWTAAFLNAILITIMSVANTTVYHQL